MKKRIFALLLIFAVIVSVYAPALANSAGGRPVPLYSVEDFFFLPETAGYSVSADGRSLLYLAQAGGILNIFRRDLATGAETQLTFERQQHITNFYLKGDTIIFTRDTRGDEISQIYRVNADGTVTNLTPFPGVTAVLVSFLERFEADDEILIAMNRESPHRLKVYRLNVLDGGLTPVLDQFVDGLIMDNDGTIRIIFVQDGPDVMLLHRYADDDEFDVVGEWNVDEFAAPAFFDSDNRYVYAVSNIGRNTDAVVRMDPATGRELEVIYARDDVDVRGVLPWRPGELGQVVYYTDKPEFKFFSRQLEALSNDISGLFEDYDFVNITSFSDNLDVLIVSTYSDVSRGGVFLVNRRTRAVELLVDRNGNIDPAHMAPMRHVEYTARDGLTIPAYLTLPVGVEHKDLPLVVIPHGGPWTRDVWGFNPEVQFLANRGYAVLQPNFRGSAGYGREFLQAGYGQWGLAMQDDVTDGVLWLIEEGVADASRVGIYGASYGGYSALAGAAFTPDLYAAVISYVGVSNLFTFLDPTPPLSRSLRELLYLRVGHPVRDHERFMATSPVFHADRITAPLFIAHGANDPRVALDESLQIVDAMTRRGVDVEFFVAWDEGHGFLNDENMEILYRVMEVFFAEHLGGRSLTTRADLPDPLFDTSPLEFRGRPRFADVSVSEWFYDFVMAAYQGGLMLGTGADTFSPNVSTTRGMAVTILHRMMGSPDAGGQGAGAAFTDVAAGAWYADAVAWAAAHGVVSGLGDGRFAPNQPVSRQDLALIFSNFAGFAEINLPGLQEYAGFLDEVDISDYAMEAVVELYESMIIGGKPYNIFDPLGSATRAEVATMLVRLRDVM